MAVPCVLEKGLEVTVHGLLSMMVAPASSGTGGVDLAVDECDGDALAGVALGPGLIELVVGEVGLVGRRDGVCSVRGSGGQDDGPGRQGQGHRTRSREAQPPVACWVSRHLAW